MLYLQLYIYILNKYKYLHIFRNTQNAIALNNVNYNLSKYSQIFVIDILLSSIIVSAMKYL
jgi:hypothetical protein